jgi:hypothetical protein
MSGGAAKTDIVQFQGPQITSEQLSKAGFSSSNFTLTVQDDGTAVWETMQSKEGGELAFWKGEVAATAQTMQGVLSRQKAPGQSEDFAFAAKRTVAQPPAPPAPPVPPTPATHIVTPEETSPVPAPEAVEPAVAQPLATVESPEAAQPAPEPPAKKKKGLW